MCSFSVDRKRAFQIYVNDCLVERARHDRRPVIREKANMFVACLALTLGASALVRGDSPLSYSGSVHPETAQQLTVCAIVEPQGSFKRIESDVRDRNGTSIRQKMLSFDVRMISGDGVKTGTIYHCLCPVPSQGFSAFPRQATSLPKRALLLGWLNSGARLAVEPRSLLDRVGHREPPSMAVAEDTVLAWSLIPSQESAVVKGADPASESLVSLAAALKDASPESVRQITVEFAAIPAEYGFCQIEGQEPGEWIRTKLADYLKSLPQTNTLERFRIGGLLACWNRKAYGLAYLRALPGYLHELGLEELSRTPGDQQEDQSFLGKLDLLTGLSGDDVLAIVWKSPALRWMALDSRLSTPSLDNQRRFFSNFETTSTETRAKMYCNLARWYGECDKMTDAKWTEAVQGTTIDHEADLHAYWTRKLFGEVKP